MANPLPISPPSQLLVSLFVTFWVLLAYELMNAAIVHSGYCLHNKAREDEIYHENFNLNYRSLGCWTRCVERMNSESFALCKTRLLFWMSLAANGGFVLFTG